MILEMEQKNAQLNKIEKGLTPYIGYKSMCET